MNLLIDMGNTRLKWAIGSRFELIAKPPLTNADIDRDSLTHLWQGIAPPEQVAISCVSTSKLFNLVVSIAKEFWPRVTVIRAKSDADAFGVANAYQQPEQLGVDRWLSMIAAYQAYRKSLCVVDCGTAITLDIIDVSGKHLGGLISPGLMLMKTSLAKGTENLNLSHSVYPIGLANSTDAAIYNGTLSAACGMVERVLKKQPDSLQLLLTGGDAETIAAEISRPAIIDPDLVLRGLALISHQPT